VVDRVKERRGEEFGEKMKKTKKKQEIENR
jgi:hypothetical protein